MSANFTLPHRYWSQVSEYVLFIRIDCTMTALPVLWIRTKCVLIPFLAPPAERQRSFSNADSSGVCQRLSASVVNFSLKKLISQKRPDNYFSSALPSGRGAFQMPTCPSSSVSSASTLRRERANLRNASVFFFHFWLEVSLALWREGLDWITLLTIAKVRKVRFGSFAHISLY